MKFKKNAAIFDVENALSDIMIISRFIPQKLRIEQMGREGEVNFVRSGFITDDTGLTDILDCFAGESVRTESKGDMHRTHISVTVKFESLLPELFSHPEGSGAGIVTQPALSEHEKLIQMLSS